MLKTEIIELLRQAYLSGIQDTQEGHEQWCNQGSTEKAEGLLQELEDSGDLTAEFDDETLAKCTICGGQIIPRSDVCNECEDRIKAEVFNEGWWINIEDDLPPVGDDVLTATHGKSLVIGHIMADGEWSHTCLVTHWQLLPQAPLSTCR